jgi:hypothetical protein
MRYQLLAEKHLYAFPNLDKYNLRNFCKSLMRGEQRWSDINIHPHSTPGRFVTSLDFSNVYPDDADFWECKELQSAFRHILRLTPTLSYLRLPGIDRYHIVDHLDILVQIPIRGNNLIGLHGLVIDHDINRQEELVSVLNSFPKLEFLQCAYSKTMRDGLGFQDNERERFMATSRLHLDQLHTLSLADGSFGFGPMLEVFSKSKLPSLRRIVFEDFSPSNDEQISAFALAHGPKIISLIYATPLANPALQLALWPNVIHISLLCLKGEDSQSYLLKAIFTPSPELPLSLKVVTLSPAFIMHGITIYPPAFLPGGPVSGIETIVLQSYKWPRSDLSSRALGTGNVGFFRQWAANLKRRGIDVRDMYGQLRPDLDHDYWLSEDPGRIIKTKRRSERLIARRSLKSDPLEEDGG